MADQTYVVPQVAFREVSKIMPRLRTVLVGIRSNELFEAVLQDLAAIIYYGVKRTAGDLTLDAFLDRPATVEEMVAALLVVLKQAGLKLKEPEPGEATGA